MRLAQIIDSLSTGGAQALLITLAETLREGALDLTVISLQDDADQPVGRALAALGVRVLACPGRGLLAPRRLWRLRQLMARERFDVLHAHLTYAIVLGWLATRGSATAFVASLHNVRPDHPRWHPLYWLETVALRQARRVVAVGQVVAAAHQARLGGRPLEVIVNAVQPGAGLSEAEAQALRAEVAGDAARPLLLAVGRLTPQKAYPDLLRAYQELRQTHPQAVLAIAGTGHSEAEVRSLIERWGLGGAVRLLGRRPDVPRLLAASDVYVLASHWEGLPVAVLEAMAAGRPVVATAVGDVPQVLAPGLGVLVPAHRPDLLAAALRGVLDDPAGRQALGQAARQHVLQHYSPAKWAGQLLAVYTAALDAPVPSGSRA